MGKTQLLRRLLVDSGAVVALICRHRYASHSYGLEREKEGGGGRGGGLSRHSDRDTFEILIPLSPYRPSPPFQVLPA